MDMLRVPNIEQATKEGAALLANMLTDPFYWFICTLLAW
jgi:hypothetical protein